MRAGEEDLLAGALSLAYKYADLAALRAAYARVQGSEAAGNGVDLAGALEAAGALSSPRAEKLRRGARLLRGLRADAVYGMIALRNRLVGAQMLNACMEESKRGGYQKTLAEVLRDRGVLTATHDDAIKARLEGVVPDLLAKERELAAVIDLEGDAAEAAELKLAMLLGEVAASVSFLQRFDVEQAIRAQARVEQGLPPEEPEPATPAPEPEMPLPPLPAQQAAAPQPGPAPAPPPGAAAPAPAAAAPPPPGPAAEPDPAQEPIKGYELLLKLGQGAMGAVLKARRRESGEIVALKILKPELAADQEYVERFLREAKAVARMGHPNVIRAIQAGRSGEYYFFAMEFIEGQTCSELVKAKGRLPERFVVMVARCIASALGHAWQHEIIHRDIKPDNIMITQDGQVKLTDLGLARSARQDSTLTITGVVMGSPAYISPEQATGEKNLDSRSDIYSLGATLYHMLTGKVPYDGETPLHVMLKHMNDPVPDVKAAVPAVSEATRQLVMRMMAKRPEQRFQTAAEIEESARAIEEALARGQEPPLPPGPAEGSSAGPDPLANSLAGDASSDDGEPLAGSGSRRGRSLSASGRGKTASAKASKKEVGERLRRMAKRKRRF